jgi:hypothetical protein
MLSIFHEVMKKYFYSTFAILFSNKSFAPLFSNKSFAPLFSNKSFAPLFLKVEKVEKVEKLKTGYHNDYSFPYKLRQRN